MQRDRAGLTPSAQGRRHFLLGSLGAAFTGSACQRREPWSHIEGGFNGVDLQRGHLLHGPPPIAKPAVFHQTGIVIAGTSAA